MALSGISTYVGSSTTTGLASQCGNVGNDVSPTDTKDYGTSKATCEFVDFPPVPPVNSSQSPFVTNGDPGSCAKATFNPLVGAPVGPATQNCGSATGVNPGQANKE